MPLVSVVIPTCNRPELVMRAIRSVLAQTLADLEVIVVIDGGCERTELTLAQLAEPRVRWIVNAVRGGAGLARDTGADSAKAPWVAFLDDDDEWLPSKLERQLALAPAVGKAVISTLYRVVLADSERICPRFIYDGREPLDEWLFGRRTWLVGHEAMLQTSSLMFPTAMFAFLRFRDTRQHEEWELCLRAVKEHGYTFLTVPEPLVVYYAPQSGQSLSKTYTYERSIGWANSVGALLTPRGYSGFALKIAWQMASQRSRIVTAGQALRAAFAHGRPTAKQLFAFALMVTFSLDFRNRIRFRRATRTAA